MDMSESITSTTIPVPKDAEQLLSSNQNNALSAQQFKVDENTPINDSVSKESCVSLFPILSLSRNRHYSNLSNRSDIPNYYNSPFPSLHLDDFMMGSFPSDETNSASLMSCLQQVNVEFQSLQRSTSKSSTDNGDSLYQIPSFRFDDNQFQLSSPTDMEIEDSAINNTFNSYSFLSRNGSLRGKEPFSRRSMSPIPATLSFSPFTDEQTCNDIETGSWGLLPRGSIRNMPLQVDSSGIDAMKALESEYPINSKNDFSMFDPMYLIVASESGEESDTHSGSGSGSGSVTSTDELFDEPNTGKKNKSRNIKKWMCSNCRYMNNLKTKRCLNCGSVSPLCSHSSNDAVTHAPSANRRKISSNSSIQISDLANPIDPIQSSEAIRQIGRDVDVGGGFTMADFPFAYIPANPYGEDSAIALKLLALRSRKVEPRICAHCGTDVTPKWRRSPPPMRFLLCNACGLQYNKDLGDSHIHSISPLEECQGEYCMRARAEGKYIKRRLFNRRLRLCYYCNRLRRQTLGNNDMKANVSSPNNQCQNDMKQNFEFLL